MLPKLSIPSGSFLSLFPVRSQNDTRSHWPQKCSEEKAVHVFIYKLSQDQRELWDSTEQHQDIGLFELGGDLLL